MQVMFSYKELEATSLIHYTFVILQQLPCVYSCRLVNSVNIQISD